MLVATKGDTTIVLNEGVVAVFKTTPPTTAPIKQMMPTDGRRFGAYGIIMAPEGLIFIEKPGRGRGVELTGGHGKPDDMSLEECFVREAFEETGVSLDTDDVRLIDEARILPTHISGIFLAQIPFLPKTLKKIGDEGEIVHVIKPRNLGEVKMFEPHVPHIKKALAILNSSKRAEKL